ncbi:ATP phosphoribosyltransferase [Nadsonia fulvescens var. elongata DSM 6958]|uniref:ATP phosphoribosyltransferase n=1 Tax=Nadsonia fulvescens var. elongata DSM 6958 TaxID=857566 RepID=A0A1E3PCP4_9ASCO|nr:ATP phosphoribosyltransferase [Nadsonia fulvescens var. elongata DSM 6958]
MDLVAHLEDRLLFAVPKKGRLYEQCLALLKGCDIQFRRNNRLDIAISTNLPIALVFLPAADIPRFVGEGRVSLGITGVDQVAESLMDVDCPIDLNFGACKLQVQVPEMGPYTDPKQLIGKNIVTSFTSLTAEYFRKLEGKANGEPLDTKIKFVGGSVEAACALGVADAIVDLVESGETMRAAGLKPIDTLLHTSAHLIQSKNPSHPEIVDMIKSRLNGVLAAKKFVLCNYNAPRDKLEDLLKITPGRRAATVSPLDDDEWVAVSSMIEQKKMATIMDSLQTTGATDILVLSISNCRV